MPIYAYKCESCGHTKDVLQKISDAPLSVCPQCGGGDFHKQVTAAGFQLKGSGWYVTDFRGGSAPAADDGAKAPAKDSADAAAPASPAPAASSAAPAPAAAAAATPAPAPAKSA